ncbi:MAG: SDR family oxidoreductase [Anaerolineae bacterium]|nr:SDR family oxidoreductase [Anaerolineae bacterium]
MHTSSKTALVTGASGGIGYELGKLFAADGFNLVLVARSEDKLNALATELQNTHGVEVTVLAKDLSDPAAPTEIYEALQSQAITVDALINNAGYGIHGAQIETATSDELNMLQLNIIALTHLTRLFLPAMVERGAGHIMNVGSTASFQPCPLMATYGASKAYVLNFTDALAEEMRGTGVRVTALCPGVTRTGFQARANVGAMRLLRGPSMTAQQVAAIGYRGLLRGRRVVIPGFFNQLIAFSSRVTPRTWVTRIARWMMEKD